MATTLDAAGIRKILEGEAISPQQAFAVAQGLCYLASAQPNSNVLQELVLLALERQNYFEQIRPVLDGLVRQLGLFPYLDPNTLGFADQLAYEFHRPIGLSEEIVFHRVQAEVYRELLDGRNVVLSAPTSFGKSLIVDAVIATQQHKNIAIVVPTIALIDETRRRLVSRFRALYKIITHPSQNPAEANIYLITQERAASFDDLDKVTFCVIDEFYKLDMSGDGDDDRAIALNQVLYRLLRSGSQFYLLGPNIKAIAESFPDRFSFSFIHTDYATVVSRQHRVSPIPTPEAALVGLCRELKFKNEPTIIYCAHPARVREIAATLLKARLYAPVNQLASAAEWAAVEYHEGWSFVNALRHGIGLHHGRIPRSLAQYVVRKFNAGEVKLLICTSTLIEGVNTKAKNIIIFDNKVAANKLDYFTFNNIRGRSGRMFEHFVGNVYLFHDPPDAELPFVDFPVFSQGQDVPDSLLLQVAPEDLHDDAADRIRPLLSQNIVEPEILRSNLGFPPEAQLSIAKEILSNVEHYYRLLAWRSSPTWEQLAASCELLWAHLWKWKGYRYHGISSGRQLAFRLSQLRKNRTPRSLIEDAIAREPEREPDEIVEDILLFLRNWASYTFPRALLALERIQSSIFKRLGRHPGNYSAYIAQVENQFTDPACAALEEYGIPLQLVEKLRRFLGTGELDDVLDRLKSIPVNQLNISPFERELLIDAQLFL